MGCESLLEAIYDRFVNMSSAGTICDRFTILFNDGKQSLMFDVGINRSCLVVDNRSIHDNVICVESIMFGYWESTEL